MQLEIELALLLNDLLTCEKLDVVKDKLKKILDNLKKESNQIYDVDDGIDNFKKVTK